MLDPGVPLEGGTRPGLISKPAMCRTIHLPTIAVGPAHIVSSRVLPIMSDRLFGVIPWDTSTATVATNEMVFGMCRHHSRMVPVATRAVNFPIIFGTMMTVETGEIVNTS